MTRLSAICARCDASSSPLAAAYAATTQTYDRAAVEAIDAVCVRLRSLGLGRHAVELWRLDMGDARDRDCASATLRWLYERRIAGGDAGLRDAVRAAFRAFREREAFARRLMALLGERAPDTQRSAL